MIVLLSLSSVVSSSANLLVVLCVVGYNELPVFSSRFCLSILPNLDTFASNLHPIHYYYCCCCFQVSCLPITQFAFLSCCARIHTFPDPESSGRVLCCAFIESPAIVCASYLSTLGMCVLFLVLGWNFHPVWYTSYIYEEQYERLL